MAIYFIHEEKKGSCDAIPEISATSINRSGGGEREWTMKCVGWRGDLNAWEMNKPYGAGGARLSFQKKEEQMQHKTLTVNGHLCCGFNNWRKDVDVIKTISADEQ